MRKKFTIDERNRWAEGIRQEHEHFAALLKDIRAKMTDDSWKAYLEVQVRFHRYSPGNAMMIHAQNPNATRVAGYNDWRKFKRHVRAGEKGLRIFAPCFTKQRNEDDVEELRLSFFRLASVFDVSQTEGEPLPDVHEHCITLVGEGHAGLYDALEQTAVAQGLIVTRVELDGGANGSYTPSTGQIEISPTLAVDQAAKTLAHELAHHILRDGDGYTGDTAVDEAEAESTAYMVCRMAGLDVASYTSGYVAVWLQEVKGAGIEAAAGILAESQGRITKAARTIAGWLGDLGSAD